MRILWVTPQLPNPRAGAGEVLEFEFLRRAGQKHRVHVISSGLVAGETNADLDSIGVSYEGVSWSGVPRPRNRLVLLWWLLMKDAGTALWQQGDRVAALSDALVRAQTEYRPEFVQVVMSEAAPVLAVATQPRGLILFDALERHLRQELAQAKRVRDRLFWGLQLRKVREWECSWYVLADRIACNSTADAEVLASVLDRSIEVIPNVIPESFYAMPDELRSTDCVAFIATLSYRPNVDAVVWLTNEIWPLVLQHCPGATLVIAGRHPVEEVVRAAAQVGASLEADVDDVRPYYWRAAALVAPIRLGSGLRNKVLHAMACEAPVVATPTALEGLDAEPGQHLLVAGDARGFADAIVETLRGPEAARARVVRARALVEGFRGEAVADKLDVWWERRA